MCACLCEIGRARACSLEVCARATCVFMCVYVYIRARSRLYVCLCVCVRGCCTACLRSSGTVFVQVNCVHTMSTSSGLCRRMSSHKGAWGAAMAQHCCALQGCRSASLLRCGMAEAQPVSATCTCAHTRTPTHIHTPTNAHTRTPTRACMHTNTHSHTDQCAHTNTNAHTTHTHTHTHTYTHTPGGPVSGALARSSARPCVRAGACSRCMRTQAVAALQSPVSASSAWIASLGPWT